MEPTNGELMTHILYIREGVDRLEKRADGTDETVKKHGEDISALKVQVPRVTRWSAIGGLVGGFLSGLLGSRAAG